jgi:hypothetical protein
MHFPLLPSCGIQGTNAAGQRNLAKAMTTHQFFFFNFSLWFFSKPSANIHHLFLLVRLINAQYPTNRYTLKVNAT